MGESDAFDVPPVCTAYWTPEDWRTWIEGQPARSAARGEQ